MSKFDLREYKKYLDGKGRLITIGKEVSIVHEMAAVLKKINGETGVFFEKIKGYDMPAVSGLTGNRQDWADYFGTGINLIREKIQTAMDNPIPWKVVENAPCQEVEIDPPANLLDFIPAPKFSEKDSGHFLTAGLVFVKEEETGNMHMSVRRMQLNDDGTLSVLIESPGLWNRYVEAEKQGKDLEMAVVIGVHPLLILASQINSYLYKGDKMAVAGALAGEAVPVVKCKTIDVMVPAYAEIVIEGKMLANVRKTEGPFGELAGYYGPASDQPILKINKITHRTNPWFQVIGAGTAEHKLPSALNREVVLYNTVKQVVPGVKDVHITVAGSGRFHGIVSINKQFEGEGRTAIIAALASNKDMKHVVVVNDDVDIFDPADVEWAISSRVQADQDVVIISEARGCPLEPSNNIRGVSAKMGIDATYPLKYKEQFERIYIPGIDTLNLDEYIKK